MPPLQRFGDFELSADERCLRHQGKPLALGARAFDLLLVLVEQRGRVVGKDELIARVWPGMVVEDNNLTVQVSALRKVLGADAIATVAGRGYRFVLGASAVPAQAAAVLAPAARAAPPSIAVLPFELRSDDPALGFLTDGLVEDVIAQLARVPGFRVVSRASSFEFRRRGEPLAVIARELGVRYVVEGSVRQVGQRLRVATQLVDADSGQVLWSGQLDRERDESLDLQAAIARGVITELEPELTRAELSLIRRRIPESVDAWGHYHAAVGAISLRGWNEDAIAEALAGFGRALAIDPDFALAHAHRALISALALTTGLQPFTEAQRDSVRQAAERAVALEDGDSQVLGYAGCALCDLGWRDSGLETLQQALAIDPSNAQAHVALGASLALQGRDEEGVARMRHGMSISPRDRRLAFWGWALSHVLLRLKRPEEALQEALASAGRDARLHLPRVTQAQALLALGRDDEAGAALAAARRLRPGLSLTEIGRVQGRGAVQALGPLWDAAAPPSATP